MNSESWFDQYEDMFIDNGYSRYPKSIYSTFLAEIDRSGKIIEFGCGNGLLLKYIVDHSTYNLVPYGIDLNSSSIENAKRRIHPEYKENFEIQDVKDLEHFDKKFDILIANPLYCNEGYVNQIDNKISHLIHDNSITKFLKQCYDLLSANGKLIFFLYKGQLDEIKDDFNFLDRSLKLVIPNNVGFSNDGTVFLYIYEKLKRKRFASI